MSYPGIPYAPDYTQYHWTRPYVYQPQYPRPPPVTYAPCEPYDPRLHAYERFDTVAQADEFREAAKAIRLAHKRSHAPVTSEDLQQMNATLLKHLVDDIVDATQVDATQVSNKEKRCYVDLESCPDVACDSRVRRRRLD